MEDRFYIDTRDDNSANTLCGRWKAAHYIRLEFLDYIDDRGFKDDIDIHLTSYKGILAVTWMRTRLPNNTIFEEIKELARDFSLKYSNNLSELIGGD